MSLPTIFVSVAAYCDPMLGFTLKSALGQASHPERVFIGVVEQALPEARLPWVDLQAGTLALQPLRWLRLHAWEARGPCWARALAMTLYQGEDWYLQVDSHTWFEPAWDERLIAWSRQLQACNPRHIVSGYPNPFRMVNGEPFAEQVGPQVLAHVVAGDGGFDAEHPVLMFESVPVASEQPVPAMHLGGGCLWAPGSLVQALPYDPFLYFHGEEQALALRAYTQGWDLWHVPRLPLYHLYHRSGQEPRPLHWSPAHDQQRSVRSAQLNAAAQQRLRALLWQGADLGVYGLGDARSLADYARFSGIDYAARHIGPQARKARFGL